MHAFRRDATKEQRERYLGVMETVWSSVSAFLDGFYGKSKPSAGNTSAAEVNTPWATFRAMYDE